MPIGLCISIIYIIIIIYDIVCSKTDSGYLPQAAAYQLAFNKPKPNKYKIINPQFSMLSDTQVQPVSLVTSH